MKAGIHRSSLFLSVEDTSFKTPDLHAVSGFPGLESLKILLK